MAINDKSAPQDGNKRLVFDEKNCYAKSALAKRGALARNAQTKRKPNGREGGSMKYFEVFAKLRMKARYYDVVKWNFDRTGFIGYKGDNVKDFVYFNGSKVITYIVSEI